DPPAAVSNRVTAPHHGLAALTHDALEPTALHVRAPGKAEARSEVMVVGIVGFSAVLELDKLRGTASEGSGLEEISYSRDSPESVGGDRRIAVVERNRWKLQFPAQAVIERQIRAHPPTVLPIESPFPLPATFKCIAEIDVFTGRLNQPGVSIDGRDASGEDSVKVFSIGQVGG